MIIDIHGHYTTEPQALHTFRDKQLAGLADSARKPASTDLGISDEAPGQERPAAAQIPEGPRRRSHHLLAARRRHGPSRRHRGDQHRVDAALQRPHSPHLHAPARQFRRCRAAAAVSRRIAEELHPGARAHRDQARIRRRQPQSRPLGRLLDRSAADRPVLVPALREAVRARCAGDDPRLLVVQPELPPHRRALHQRRHDRLHAADPGQSLQGFPDAAGSSSRMAAGRCRTTGGATAGSPRT